MKVALVSFAGAPDAPELAWPAGQVLGLAEALTERGDEVVVFTRRQPTDDRPRPAYQTVGLRAGPARALAEADAITYLGEYVDALGRELRERQPDVVHSHTWLAGLATHLASRDGQRPVVHSFHWPQLARPERPGRHPGQRVAGGRLRAERAVALHADRLIALSHAEQDRLIHAGVAQSRIAVVPPGVDIQRLSPQGPSDERGQRHRLVVFGPLRRAEPAVQALTALTDTELVVVDTLRLPAPPETEKVRRLLSYAASLGVADRLSLLREPGSVDRRAALIRSADLVLAYPEPDRWAHGHLEAMACGVPVVAGTIQAEEAVVDGVTGVRASDSDPRQLAKTLRGLLESGTLRQGMGLAGRDRATGRYSWARIAEETARVYEEVRQPTPASPQDLGVSAEDIARVSH